jgi:hypothetical protein
VGRVHLAVTATLVLFAAGLMAFERVATGAPNLKLGLLLLMVACAPLCLPCSRADPAF